MERGTKGRGRVRRGRWKTILVEVSNIVKNYTNKNIISIEDIRL
jgi:hypothetical protein